MFTMLSRLSPMAGESLLRVAPPSRRGERKEALKRRPEQSELCGRDEWVRLESLRSATFPSEPAPACVTRCTTLKTRAGADIRCLALPAALSFASY